MNELPNPTFPLSISAPRLLTRGLLCRSDQNQNASLIQRDKKPTAGKILVQWARHQDEVRQAQRLRYSVFALEMGAILPKIVPGHDIDLFDDYCEHLLVRDEATMDVIGTYRVLTPTQAKRVG
ncbi:MAG: GNAT family N-acetyltransferase, partial [Polaromonas sp.]|nr:GNAT family N-acetyltransferase [Polaromonas sp.]